MSNLSGYRYFTKLDLIDAYLQMEQYVKRCGRYQENRTREPIFLEHELAVSLEPTKRNVVSLATRINGPLEILFPFVVCFKILRQG